VLDEEEAGDEPVSAPLHGADHVGQSRAGGHLVSFIRYARLDRGPLVVCTCGAEIRTETDAELTSKFSTHRRTEITEGRGEAMERVRVESGVYVRYELRPEGAPPPRPTTAADTMTSHEQRHGWDRAPAAPLPLRRLGGRSV
jgi:hypothetical protein